MPKSLNAKESAKPSCSKGVRLNNPEEEAAYLKLQEALAKLSDLPGYFHGADIPEDQLDLIHEIAEATAELQRVRQQGLTQS